jgi:hypothetical protein
MLKSTRVIAAAAITAVMILGGGAAFTASNVMPSSVAGYGESTVTGATVTAINYTLNSTDSSKLASVVFTAVPPIDDSAVAGLTLKNGGTSVESDSCVVSTSSGISTITCATAGAPLINSFDGTGLTVIG